MRMRQSLAELEQAFAKEIRRSSPSRLVASHDREARARAVQRRHKRGSFRFVLLVLTLIMTVAIVDVVMFRTLDPRSAGRC